VQHSQAFSAERKHAKGFATQRNLKRIHAASPNPQLPVKIR
jgi:hypothetical protein